MKKHKLDECIFVLTKNEQGAFHKVRYARGGGVREGASLWQRRGQRACDVTLLKLYFIHNYET